jgi:hypothetical protein
LQRPLRLWPITVVGKREPRQAAVLEPTHAVVAVSPKKETVEILRGDRFEERKFEARDRDEDAK